MYTITKMFGIKYLVGEKMAHRIDLKALGYKSVKYGSKEDVKKLACMRKASDVQQKIVKAPKGLWELYEKKK